VHGDDVTTLLGPDRHGAGLAVRRGGGDPREY